MGMRDGEESGRKDNRENAGGRERTGGGEERKRQREREGVKQALILPSFQTFTAFNGAVSNRREKEGNK